MAEIFRECRRVIKPDGIMTVMFTHKSTDAWDALTVALIESGFGITRTWPVKTESDASIHIMDRAAARSTILLVCRPRLANPEPQPWHIVENRIAQAVREDITTLQTYGLNPVDQYLASFGPALQVISENWGTERAMANPGRPGNEFAVTPTDALDVARREVIAHRTREISERWAESPVGPNHQVLYPRPRWYRRVHHTFRRSQPVRPGHRGQPGKQRSEAHPDFEGGQNNPEISKGPVRGEHHFVPEAGPNGTGPNPHGHSHYGTSKQRRRLGLADNAAPQPPRRGVPGYPGGAAQGNATRARRHATSSQSLETVVRGDTPGADDTA